MVAAFGHGHVSDANSALDENDGNLIDEAG